MCVNNLSKVALDSAAAGIEPAISIRKTNALTTTPPSHTYRVAQKSISHYQIIKKLCLIVLKYANEIIFLRQIK